MIINLNKAKEKKYCNVCDSHIYLQDHLKDNLSTDISQKSDTSAGRSIRIHGDVTTTRPQRESLRFQFVGQLFFIKSTFHQLESILSHMMLYNSRYLYQQLQHPLVSKMSKSCVQSYKPF